MRCLYLRECLLVVLVLEVISISVIGWFPSLAIVKLPSRLRSFNRRALAPILFMPFFTPQLSFPLFSQLFFRPAPISQWLCLWTFQQRWVFIFILSSQLSSQLSFQWIFRLGLQLFLSHISPTFNEMLRPAENFFLGWQCLYWIHYFWHFMKEMLEIICSDENRWHQNQFQ